MILRSFLQFCLVMFLNILKYMEKVYCIWLCSEKYKLSYITLINNENENEKTTLICFYFLHKNQSHNFLFSFSFSKHY